MAIILELGSSKKVSVLTTQKLLEFLGDLLGFKEALGICFSFFAVYVSSRLFKADMVTNLLKTEDGEEKLKLSMLHILCEPLIEIIVKFFCCDCCCKTRTYSNQKLLDEGQQQVENQLEIIQFLGLMNELQTKHIKDKMD
jgi:hypothetical protein